VVRANKRVVVGLVFYLFKRIIREMNRFVLGSVLVTCLLVLCTYHAAYHDLYEAHPGTEEVINGVEGIVLSSGE